VAYGSADAAAIWMNPRGYMNSDDTTFGKTNDEIQKSWKKLYNDNGIKIVLSAFGATWLPTAENAQITCDRLAELVIQNNLDGIDLDYEDNDAMNHGKAEEWLIKCTQTIRQKLPKGQYLLTHAPQAPYFIGKRVYPNGGYVTIN
jgi:chitinase